MSSCSPNGGPAGRHMIPCFVVPFPWRRPEKCGEGLREVCYSSSSTSELPEKARPACVSPPPPPWNALFTLFSRLAARRAPPAREVPPIQEQTKALFENLMDEEMSRQTATALPTGTSKCPPSQRVSTLSGTTASNSDLASLFECPVCFDYVLPPILQCQSGHLVCSNCRPKLTCCPTCRGPLGSIRNLAMEKVANSVLFPCKYASSGCEVTLPHTEKTEHEELCEFRPYSCPCPGASCKWQGSLDAVMPHLMHQHKSITTLQGEDIVFLATDINLPGAVDWVMMQSCFGFHFMLVLEKQEKYDGHQQFFAIVQLIGTRKQAENFAYRLELNGHRRRLTWEATPRSIHEGIATAIMNSDCLVFDTSIAQLFAENGNLGINVTISMC
ncbi:E3 ubiquitin-protein ligase Siah1 isoform 2-T2 [Menidia menidia]